MDGSIFPDVLLITYTLESISEKLFRDSEKFIRMNSHRNRTKLPGARKNLGIAGSERMCYFCTGGKESVVTSASTAQSAVSSRSRMSAASLAIRGGSSSSISSVSAETP